MNRLAALRPAIAPTLAFAIACLGSPQAHAIFKCQGQDGRITYQESPCPHGGERIDARSSTGRAVAPPPVENADVGPRKGQSRAEYNRIVTAMASGEPVIGMTREQLIHALGQPQRMIAGQYREGAYDRLIYERPGGTIYVSVHNGLVRSIQTAVGYKPAPKTCPSALDIRNAETAAGSITLSDDERRRQLRQIEKMKACRQNP